MPYDHLIKSKRIKPYRASQSEIKQLLQLAKRDLSAAMRNLEEAPDWVIENKWHLPTRTDGSSWGSRRGWRRRDDSRIRCFSVS